MKKIISIILSAALIASLFSACSSDGDKSIDIIYPISGEVNSYDPQVASTMDEYLIDENCYEGLVRIDDSGNIKQGVATNWSVSNGGLTYKFTLRQGAKWYVSDEAKDLIGNDFNPDVTAKDFAFALRRAVDPATGSLFASTLSSIKGASAIIAGKASSDTLSVVAEDDYNLTINLQYADDNFLKTLTTGVAMPCNENFFNATKGRYGLGGQNSLFNGPFYVSSQLEASYILKKNTKYAGKTDTNVSDITLKVVDKTAENYNTDMVENIESGYYDAAYLTSTQYAAMTKDSGVTTYPYSNITWSFLLNCNSGSLSEKKIRKALCMSLSYPDLKGKDYFADATGVVPPSCTAEGERVTSDNDITVISRDPQKGAELWKQGLEKTGATVIGITIITTPEMSEMAKELIQGIQSGIGKVSTYGDNNSIAFSMKIETMTLEEMNTAIAGGSYDIALYPLEANTSSAVSFLEDVANRNLSNFQSKSLPKAIAKAEAAPSGKQRTACLECEKQLMSTYSIMPVIYESGYYAAAKGVSGIDFHPGSGRVSFINAKREK